MLKWLLRTNERNEINKWNEMNKEKTKMWKEEEELNQKRSVTRRECRPIHNINLLEKKR